MLPNRYFLSNRYYLTTITKDFNPQNQPGRPKNFHDPKKPVNMSQTKKTIKMVSAAIRQYENRVFLFVKGVINELLLLII